MTVPFWRRHPDLTCLLVVVAVATLLRGAILFRAPVLATGDSEGYLAPGYALATGAGFDVSDKRTPAYPALIALAIAIGGEDLRSLLFAQHLLGVVTAALTFVLGRLCFTPARVGRVVGLVGGLLIALNGALILAEHSLLSEALFVPLVTATFVVLAAAMRSGSLWLYGGAGLLLGAATLTRPVAQVLVPLIPIAALLMMTSWRGVLARSVVGLVAFGLTLAPWMIESAAEHDTASVGSLGQSLVGRTARHDRGAFTYYDPARDAADDPARITARKILQQAADSGSSGKAINTRLRRELGISAADADRLMRDLAVQAILRKPGYYVLGTLQRFARMADGSVERLRDARNTADIARQRWEDEPTRHLLQAATPAEDRAADTASLLVSIWQPGYAGVVLPILALLGTIVAFFRYEWRPAVVLGLAAFALLFLSAALVGNVSRYRYPVDPLMAVLAVGAVAWLVEWARAGRPVRSSAAPSAPHPPTPSPARGRGGV